MCDSLEEGGTRCAAHTRPAYHKVAHTLVGLHPSQRHLVISGPFSAEETNAQVVAAHASTPTGHTEVIDLAEDLTATDPRTADWLRHCVKNGEAKAEAARAVKAQIARRSIKATLRRIGVARNTISGPPPDWVRTAAEQEAEARFDTFTRLAEGDRSLRAPEGWMERFRATGGHTVAVPGDRVTGYALWRTHSTGSDFAPADYDPAECVRVVTGPDGFRPGDVLDEPNACAPGAVQHEGKTVAAVIRDDAGHPVTLGFTDGTHASVHEFTGQHTVYRPVRPTERDQVRRYSEVNERASHTGYLPGQGWYVEDPDTGERVFDPWGV